MQASEERGWRKTESTEKLELSSLPVLVVVAVVVAVIVAVVVTIVVTVVVAATLSSVVLVALLALFSVCGAGGLAAHGESCSCEAV